MNFYTESKLLSLSSESATVKLNSDYNSDVLFELIGLVKKDPEIVRIEMSLLNAQIPVSFYTINYSNKYFKLSIDNALPIVYEITEGNYNANSLITELSSKLQHANFTITFNKITGKLNFTHNKTFTIYNNIPYSIGPILGFEKNSVITSTIISGNYQINPPYPLNLLGIKRLSILSQELPSVNASSITRGQDILMATIPVEATQWGMINYHNYTTHKHIINTDTIDKIDIKITDEYHNLIDFNNCDWTMTWLINLTKKYFQQSETQFNDIVGKSIIKDKIEKKPIKNKDLEELEFLMA